jgi:hypothetical protein
MMFSYETNAEIMMWSLILGMINCALILLWGASLADGRDTGAIMRLGRYLPVAIVLCIISAVYFGTRNIEEDNRRREARYQEIYQQGMTAAENGIPDSACPFRKSGGKYATSSPDERKWLEGWTAKKIQMNKEQKP